MSDELNEELVMQLSCLAQHASAEPNAEMHEC